MFKAFTVVQLEEGLSANSSFAKRATLELLPWILIEY